MEFNFPVDMCFIDYSKAFDNVQHQKLWTTLISMGFPKHVIELLRTLYDHQESTVRTACYDTDWLTSSRGFDKDVSYLLICLMHMQNTSYSPLKTMMVEYHSKAECLTTCVMLMILPC